MSFSITGNLRVCVCSFRSAARPLFFFRGIANATAEAQKDTSITKASDTTQVISADTVSGVPEGLCYRTVRIYKPSRNVMQSGTHNTKLWRLDFDILEGGSRWENPLIGWASSADCVQALQMKFASKSDAILFAEKQGWDYYVQEPKEQKFQKKVYGDNFKYSPGKLRFIKTK